jgi:hypothetical protein
VGAVGEKYNLLKGCISETINPLTHCRGLTIPGQGSCDSLLLQVVPLKLLFYALYPRQNTNNPKKEI